MSGFGEQSDFKLPRKVRDGLRGKVKRVEAHGSTPGCRDSRGRDWNNDTLVLFMDSGARVEVRGGCFGLVVRLRGSSDQQQREEQ